MVAFHVLTPQCATLPADGGCLVGVYMDAAGTATKDEPRGARAGQGHAHG